MSSNESNPELESFREQWKAEVQAKHAVVSSQKQQQRRQNRATAGPSTAPARTTHAAESRGKLSAPPPPTKKPAQDFDEDYVQTQSFDEPAGTVPTELSQDKGEPKAAKPGEPVSALEHYEKAVEKEVAGNLGDSLRLYRKAFRMDDSVDQKYKNKHFPKPPPKPAQAASSDAQASTSKAELPQTMKELIASFSVLSIAPAPPEVEGMEPPPCPIASIPEEILVHILRDVAILDVGDFVRLARVCKRLAYLVATEDRIWRRICLGTEFGFGGMHYHWQRQITWAPLTKADLLREATSTTSPTDSDTDPADLPPLTPLALAHRQAQQNRTTTLALHTQSPLYGSSWQRMFRLRPRVRFNGCYISTVNYQRAGQASANQVTWGSPVHIVTYYRYLRFFRDGTVLSLSTTHEPAEVVHHLTREAVELHKGGAAAHLPSVVVQGALRGRWRLGRGEKSEGDGEGEGEGDVMVETVGVGDYMYRLDLGMGSAGKGARNNKLMWKGFYSYHRLTGDWAEFTMRNNKPFFFSRVRSYGVKGE